MNAAPSIAGTEHILEVTLCNYLENRFPETFDCRETTLECVRYRADKEVVEAQGRHMDGFMRQAAYKFRMQLGKLSSAIVSGGVSMCKSALEHTPSGAPAKHGRASMTHTAPAVQQ